MFKIKHDALPDHGVDDTTRLEIEASIEKEINVIRAKMLKDKLRIEAAKTARSEKGLKTNKITTRELKLVLEHFFSSKSRILTRSFNHIYENSTKGGKEFDWCKRIPSSLYYGKELTAAFISSNHSKVKILKAGGRFDIKSLLKKTTLSKRIKQMATDLEYEEVIINKDMEIEKLRKDLEESRKNDSWETKAGRLLDSGLKQQQVADQVGKGISTIKRLVAKRKKQGQ